MSGSCYFVRGFQGERVLIPGCWMSLHLDYCWCEENSVPKYDATNDELERKIEKLSDRISQLEAATRQRSKGD